MLNEFLTSIANRGLAIIGMVDSERANVSCADVINLCHRLLSSRGEASGLALSREVLSLYGLLSAEEKFEFFEALRDDFGPNQMAIKSAAQNYLEDQSSVSLLALADAAKPTRQELFARLNQAPEATRLLVEMRADLLLLLDKDKSFSAIDRDFVELFTAWFNRGFLELKRVDWNTSASILEKIIQYEAVHGISGWQALRERIDPPDRHIYAFFHPRLENEPLIFVEVALLMEMPNSIDRILDENRVPIDAEKANTAAFYSISNCQKGLRGIPLGNFLIKQVVEDLRNWHPNLRDFVTLSPLPSLCRWLSRNAKSNDVQLPEKFTEAWQELADAEWDMVKGSTSELDKKITPGIAWFLREAKGSNNRPFDPVARFHLGNGARLERINLRADSSENGKRQSCGIMVNYRYLLNDIEQNHEQFANEGKVVSATSITKTASSFADEIAVRTDELMI